MPEEGARSGRGVKEGRGSDRSASKVVRGVVEVSGRTKSRRRTQSSLHAGACRPREKSAPPITGPAPALTLTTPCPVLGALLSSMLSLCKTRGGILFIFNNTIEGPRAENHYLLASVGWGHPKDHTITKLRKTVVPR